MLPQIENFRPLGNKLLLSRHERADKIGDIYIPQTAGRTDMAHFTVLKTGKDCEACNPGDVVLAPCQMSFTKIEMAGEKLEIAAEDLMTAVIPKGDL